MSRTTMLFRLVLFSLLIAVGAAPAVAEESEAQDESQVPSSDANAGDSERRGKIEITPFVGLRTHGAFRTGEETNNLFVEVEQSATYGLFLDYRLTDHLKAEALFTHQGSQVVQGDIPIGENVPVPPFAPGETLFDVGIDYLHGGMVYDGGNDTFSGYAGAAAGLARLSPDVGGVSAVNKFSFSLGVGFTTFFTERVGLRFDARAFGLRAGDTEEVFASGGVYDPVTFKRASTFWQNHFVVGVVFRL